MRRSKAVSATAFDQEAHMFHHNQIFARAEPFKKWLDNGTAQLVGNKDSKNEIQNDHYAIPFIIDQ